MEYNEKNMMNKQNKTVCFSATTEYLRSAMTFGPLLNDRSELDFDTYILAEAKALKSTNAEEVAKFLYEEIICRFGAPKKIQSDQGTHFVNELIHKLTEKFRIKHKKV